MKCDKIEILFHTARPEDATLVDFPAYCEVVHVSGDVPEDGQLEGFGTAYLHINTPDKPSKARNPSAFYVIADGVDVPGFVISKRGDQGASNRGMEDGDIEPTFIRRVGKFTADSGVLFFVFERL